MTTLTVFGTVLFGLSITPRMSEYTVVIRTKETSVVYRSKMAFFKRAWQKVKVLPRP